MKGYQLPVYAYQPAPEQLTGQPVLHDVVVVGAGLAGLTTALSLGVRGIRVVVLDDDNTVGVRGLASRGVCYANRSLQILRHLGVYERVAAKGVHWSHARIMENDRCLYEYSLTDSEAESLPAFINIQQYYLEQYLVERIAELPNVEIRWRNAVRHAGQDEGKVVLSVETPDGGYRVHGKWVVACDGPQSTVRKTLGIEPAISTFDDTWLIVDFELKESFPYQRIVWIESEDNQGRAVWFHPMADNVWRLDYQIGKRHDAQKAADPEVVSETVRKVLAHHFGRDDIEFELVWVGPWAYRTYVLDSFRHGRVMFAGDAAHLKSPFGARGGNSGIQDAENLAWKLERVIRRQSPAELLDTYSEERREAALENVAVTTRTARFLTPRAPHEQRMRRVVQQLARSMPFARQLVNGGRMSQANVYTRSPVCVYSTDTPAGSGVEPGNTAVDARVRTQDGRIVSLMSLLGNEFTLLLIAAGRIAEPVARLLRQSAELDHGRIGVMLIVAGGDGGSRAPSRIQVLEDSCSDVASRYGHEGASVTAYLIRPDCYIGWRQRDPDLAAIEDAVRVCGGYGLPSQDSAEKEASHA